ncbi:helix-turn-helix transcriptional regulator [Kitasatospora sp. CB02891]|uniref:helix-turn-helix transcriptional regulator n=1 Tax=Kitasatospora sp. CB02891 TaxID=2020329 RepID=UPI001E4E9BE8|nr:helix-turn-helix transcriptional regulator [Kitasatospora sp. CB02891]
MPFKIHLPPHLLMDRQVIGSRIKALREARGWTQENLAEHSGLHRNTIIRMETSAQAPSLDAYLVVADALDVPIWRLFQDE